MGIILIEALDIMETIIDKLTIQIKELNSRPTPKYYDDPDDPPVERCPPFSFVECPNYHTCSKTITFNLKYMLRNINKGIAYSKKALDETSDLPMNEYKWWECPLELASISPQINYYMRWERIGKAVDRVDRREIDHIIELGIDNCIGELRKLVIKYDLRWDDWIWTALAVAWGLPN
jgi:hypothetical protein